MLKALADYYRLLRAGGMLARHDVLMPSEIRDRLPWPGRLVGMILRILPGARRKGRVGQRFALALEKMGPAYVKLGQFLATRPDIMGIEAATDLSRLKDNVPPFSVALAKTTLKTEFQDDADRLFPDLDAPVAAASIAQVHKIETPEGPKALKILRPRVETLIERELRAMQRAARIVEDRAPDSRRLRPVDAANTLAESLTRELDLRFEAGAASEFAEIIKKDGFVTAPGVDWTRTNRRVLTTDWVDGVPMTQPDALEGVDRVAIANKVTRGFLACALDHGFFHADLHEGNMIITAPEKPDGEHGLALVDFGIMGRIGPEERLFLAEILNGFLNRNYKRVAEVHFRAGYVPDNHSVDDFAQALRSVGEPIFGRTADDVSMGRLLIQLFDITHQFGMRLRPELVLLQKTMVQVEGVARNIDPEHNIWDAARPIVKRWVNREFGPQGAARVMEQVARDAAERFKRLPEVLDKIETALEPRTLEPAQKRSRFEFIDWLGFALLIGTITGVLGFYIGRN